MDKTENARYLGLKSSPAGWSKSSIHRHKMFGTKLIPYSNFFPFSTYTTTTTRSSWESLGSDPAASQRTMSPAHPQIALKAQTTFILPLVECLHMTTTLPAAA